LLARIFPPESAWLFMALVYKKIAVPEAVARTLLRDTNYDRKQWLVFAQPQSGLGAFSLALTCAGE
jgi:hypothetical protein